MKLASALVAAFAVALAAALWLAVRSPRAADASARRAATPEEAPLPPRPPADVRAEPSARAAPEGTAPAALDAPASGPSAALDASEALARKLDEVCDTFLTEAPAAAELDAVLKELLQGARVVEESVQVDPDTGEITGRMELASGTMARFLVRGDRYELSLMERRADDVLLLRQVQLGATDGGAGLARLHAGVQFHPDTNRSAAGALPEGGRIVGWGLHNDAGQGTARPIRAQPGDDGRSWLIGGEETLDDLPGAFGAGGDAAVLLVRALSPLKRPR